MKNKQWVKDTLPKISSDIKVTVPKLIITLVNKEQYEEVYQTFKGSYHDSSDDWLIFMTGDLKGVLFRLGFELDLTIKLPQ